MRDTVLRMWLHTAVAVIDQNITATHSMKQTDTHSSWEREREIVSELRMCDCAMPAERTA